MEVECVSPLCPGDQLPPPCGGRFVPLAVGVVLSLPYLLLVVVDEDTVPLIGVQLRPEAE